jgi:hypothetical protein
VSPVRFERTLPSASCWCLLPLGYEDLEPPPGADPGHPRYEGGAAAVRGGRAAGQGLEPRSTGSEPAVLPLDDPASLCGRRELNPHLDEEPGSLAS